jgi:hypothetical protein
LLALDEDEFADSIGEAGVLDDLLGLPGVARSDLGILQHGGPDRGPGDGNHHDEREPAENGGGSVPGGPSS